MNRTKILEKLNEIFRDVFDDPAVTVNEQTTAADIDGWDSLMHISLISAVEEEFGVSFPMKTILAMKNVGDLANAVADRTRADEA